MTEHLPEGWYTAPRVLEYPCFIVRSVLHPGEGVLRYQVEIHRHYTYVTDAVHGGDNKFPGWSANLYFDTLEEAVELGLRITPIILEAAALKSRAGALGSEVTRILNHEQAESARRRAKAAEAEKETSDA